MIPDSLKVYIVFDEVEKVLNILFLLSYNNYGMSYMVF
jgi:hypothetical protein